jgi:hypothetical protein
MAITRGRLADIQTIPSTVGSIYSNPASTITFVSGFTLFNSNTTAETVKLHNVPDSGGSVGTATVTNQFLELSLAAGETFIYEAPSDGIVLEDTNDSIQAVTTTASKVTVMIHGVRNI